MPEVHLYKKLMVSCLFIVFMSVDRSAECLAFRVSYKSLFPWF